MYLYAYALAKGRQTFSLNKETDEEEDNFLLCVFHVAVNLGHQMAKLKDKPQENISVATEVRRGYFRYLAYICELLSDVEGEKYLSLFTSVSALRSTKRVHG